MSRTRVSACAFVVAASLAGCMGTGDVEYAGEVRVTSPELIEISPGVQVIADADEPIFYSHGHYWLYRDGYWLRSGDYRRGYARVEFTYVPSEIRVIERPQIYVQYRRNLGRDRAARTPNLRTRSQPTYQQPYQPPQQAQPQPTYPPPAPSQPGYQHPTQPTTSPTSPVHQPPPRGPGADPTQPTMPPGPHDRVITPNDNRREPAPQRQVPPEIDRTSPGNAPAVPPGQANKPQDRPQPPGQAKQDQPQPPGQANKPQQDRGPQGVAKDPEKDRHEHAPPSDAADRATPPGQNKTDDRTKKADDKKDKKDKKAR